MNAHLKDSRDRYVVRIPKPRWFLAQGVSTIPSYVWRTSKFPFMPRDYAISHERLQNKIVSSSVQLKSLETFLANPCTPCIYGVGAEPTDSYSLYFAAYLAYLFTAMRLQMQDRLLRPIGDVRWETLRGGYHNPLIYEDGSTNENIGMLILSGITPNSTPNKLEKLRETLVAYSHIPRVVVIAGEDPLTFFSARIHHKLTNMYFHSGALSKRAVEVL